MAERKEIKPGSNILKLVAQSAASKSNHVHVISRGNKWIVRRNKASRALRIFNTIDEAIENATLYVNTGKAVFAVVHDRNGMVTEKITA